MSAALFDPDAIVRAVRAAAKLAPSCDIRDFATNPADCRKVATVAKGDALANGGECRNVAIVAAPLALDDADAANEALADAIEERAGLAADRVPAVYLDAWARLNCQKPFNVTEADWWRALDDGGRFLDAWGETAAALGWTSGDLFDVSKGLVWQLAGRRVEAIELGRVFISNRRLQNFLSAGIQVPLKTS